MESYHQIEKYFARLGFTPELTSIYLALHAHGTQTISELSRTSGLERTRIYRALDELKASGLVEIETRYKRSLISAAPITNLEMLLKRKQTELDQLTAEFGTVSEALSSSPTSSPTTRIQYYQGAAGLRQLLWNQLRATTEIIAYAYQILDAGVGRPFMNHWVAEFERRGLHKRLLLGPDYITSWHAQPGHRVKGIQYHFISPDTFTITHNCLVYDDVTSYLHWKDGEVFGVEIYNSDIAGAQRQLLEHLWPQSTPGTQF